MLVSIVMITYNHEKYIREAIEGVLMQKTNFDFELIIANDASLDATDKIIKDLILKDSRALCINYIKHQKNIGMMPNFIFALQQAKGKYIAMCEGDDYWTDSTKLQKQVDFLDENENFSICSHNMKISYTHSEIQPIHTVSVNEKNVYTIEDVANRQTPHIYTASCVFRNILNGKLPDWYAHTPAGDYPLYLLLTQFGNLRYMPETMGVFRLNAGGIWSQLKPEEAINKDIKMLDFLISTDFSQNILSALVQQKRNSINKLLQYTFSINFQAFIKLLELYAENDAEIANYWLKIGFPKEINLLKNSRSYKFAQKLKQIITYLNIFKKK
jgi:glycosyltransferase involved in cell wall biosynthesis